ncbi:GIY-YIG nuclease family protein [Sediminicola luteus]|jgi:putative endonuclease|uniref:Endonuclease n=1 Tax=Sediminicola luteus TaxID=319238 RepID=A0A2A4GB00_9FLAO|nr:GIY-YIG nuclease family protein [Sediminicola luteus]PCE65777.1 endonuclease [Sediminicola luteus]
MANFVTYILYSEKYSKIYIGYTSNLIARFKSHNELGQSGYTKKFRPWMVAWVFFHDSKKEALAHERFLKSGKGREYIYAKIL